MPLHQFEQKKRLKGLKKAQKIYIFRYFPSHLKFAFKGVSCKRPANPGKRRSRKTEKQLGGSRKFRVKIWNSFRSSS